MSSQKQSQLSSKQLAANRQNAQYSTGAKTQAGKQVVKTNSVTHGISANTRILPWETLAEYEAFEVEYLDMLRPMGPLEALYADRMLLNAWRLKRAERYEGILAATLNDEPFQLVQEQLKLDRQVARLESRIDRAWQALKKLQQERIEAIKLKRRQEIQETEAMIAKLDMQESQLYEMLMQAQENTTVEEAEADLLEEIKAQVVRDMMFLDEDPTLDKIFFQPAQSSLPEAIYPIKRLQNGFALSQTCGVTSWRSSDLTCSPFLESDLNPKPGH